jgi:hypothetical protein
LMLLILIVPLLAACGGQAPSGFTPVSGAASPSAGAPATPSPAAAAAAASGPPSSPVATSAASSAASGARAAALVLRVGTGTADESLISVDAATGRLLARLPIGVPDDSWATLYSTAENGSTTVLRALDTRTGDEIRRTELPGSWALPTVVPSALPVGIAPLAERLVLVDRTPAKGTSRFATIGTDFKVAPTIIDLKGQFEFDAVGPNARYLYLIEQIGGGHYQVRSYDLQMGSLLEGAIIDKREVDEKMEGRPIARAVTDDGAWTYTLYLREEGTAFVHQLQTMDGAALCVDLPEDIRAVTDADANAWRLATTGSEGGFVANGRLRFLANIGVGDVTASTRLAGSSAVELAAGAPGNAFLLGPDGIMAIDGKLKLLGHGLGNDARAVAMTPSGDALYVLSQGGRVDRVRTADWSTPDATFKLDPAVDWSGATIEAVIAG